MAHLGSRPDHRTEVAPPRDPATRVRRSGYIMLAASGVVLATAFGGIAQLFAPSMAPSGLDGARGGNTNPGSEQVIPGNALPGDDPATSSGEAHAPSSAAAPTAVVSIGADGQKTVTLLPPAGSAQIPITLPPGSPIPPGTTVVTTTTDPTTDPPTTRSSTPPTTTTTHTTPASTSSPTSTTTTTAPAAG